MDNKKITGIRRYPGERVKSSAVSDKSEYGSIALGSIHKGCSQIGHKLLKIAPSGIQA